MRKLETTAPLVMETMTQSWYSQQCHQMLGNPRTKSHIKHGKVTGKYGKVMEHPPTKSRFVGESASHAPSEMAPFTSDMTRLPK